MSWQEILPGRGQRAANHSHAFAVAWRKGGSSRTCQLIVTGTAWFMQELGWQAKQRVRILLDTDAGLLRLQRVATGGFAICVSKGYLTQKITIPDIRSEPRGAEPALHAREGDAVIIILPDWAAPDRRDTPEAVEKRAYAMALATGTEPLRQSVAPVAPEKEQPVARFAAPAQPARPPAALQPPPPPPTPPRAAAPAPQQPATTDRPRHVSIMERVPDQGIGRRNG